MALFSSAALVEVGKYIHPLKMGLILRNVLKTKIKCRWRSCAVLIWGGGTTKNIKTKQKPDEAVCYLMMSSQRDCFLHDLSTSSGGPFQKRHVGILNNIIVVGLSSWSPKVTGLKRSCSLWNVCVADMTEMPMLQKPKLTPQSWRFHYETQQSLWLRA